MKKLFKSYILNTFIVTAFFLSQTLNVHASHLSNNAPREDVSVIEQVQEKATRLAAFYVPSLNYGETKDTPVEGKFEKVLEPITLGTFGIAMLAGYGASIVGMFLAWVIKQFRTR